MIIGLTGGIACGKSIVAEALELLGARIVDCDVLARDFVQKGSQTLEIIKQTFGLAVFANDGSLDRKALAAVIFGSPRERAKLEAILHPPIIERLKAEVSNAREKGETLVIVAPLLIEANLSHLVDQVWVVRSKESTIIKRLKLRDGISGIDAMRRINAQMPLSEKSKYADVIIENDGSIDELRVLVRSLWEQAITGEVVAGSMDGDDK